MIGGLAADTLAPLVPVWLIALLVIFRRFGRRLSGTWLDALVVSAYVPAAAVFFWLPLFVSGFFMPRGGGDFVSYYYPTYRYAAEMLRAGVFPLWNPYLYGGSPFFADVEASVLYPLNLAYHMLVPAVTYRGMELLLIAHYVIAGAGTYVYVRSMGLSRLPAFAAGVVFAFSGFNVARFGHVNILIGAVWLPLILLFVDRILVRGRVVDAVCAGVLYGVVTLGAHPQMPVYFALFFVFYVLVRVRTVAREQGYKLVGGFLPRARCLVLSGCAALLAGAIAAVQLLPGLELAALSVRVADFSYGRSSSLSLEPLGFIGFLVPHFFGDNPAEHWGLQSGLVEIYAYAGISTLVFASVAFACRRNRRGLLLLFATGAALFALLALGENTILHALTYRFLPGFSTLRAAGRFLLFVDLAIAVLAAVGLEAMMRPLPSRWRRPFNRLMLFIGLVLLVVIALTPFFYYALLTSQDKDRIIVERIATAASSLNMSALFLGLGLLVLAVYRYGGRHARTAAMIATVVIILDLFSANAGFNVTRESPGPAFAPNEITRFLTERPDGFRFDAATGIEDIWQPNSALLYRLSDVMGLDKALFLRDYRRYWENLGSRSTAAYDLLGAKFLLARKDVQLDWSKFALEKSDHPRLNVYRNDKALPRAMLVPAAEVATGDVSLRKLRRWDFDPTRIVLVDRAVEDEGNVQADQARVGDVVSVQYPTANEVEVGFHAYRNGYLLLNDVMYPGWRAYEDGKEIPVYRANYTFRAVKAREGEHMVRFAFQPAVWRIGVALSLLGVAAVMSTLIFLIVAKARMMRSCGSE